jgi:choline-phosphate cytidylyltransferase
MSSASPAPFSTDNAAIEERNKCDYTIKITTDMAKSGAAPRKIRVYATGVWDIFHQGHAECLSQSKNFFPICEIYVIAAVPSDQLTHQNKGATLMNHKERAEILRQCRYVFECCFKYMSS